VRKIRIPRSRPWHRRASTSPPAIDRGMKATEKYSVFFTVVKNSGSSGIAR
jgi:hypothetical protein